jgi:hypothetical protein
LQDENTFFGTQKALSDICDIEHLITSVKKTYSPSLK